jgi:hypothetical protein
MKPVLPKSAEEQIIKHLKKRNRHIWKDEIIREVLVKINNVRTGVVDRKDWYIPGLISYEDWLSEMNLISYL